MYVCNKGWLVAEEGDPPLVIIPSVRATKLAMKVPRAVIWHWTGPVEDVRQHVESIQTYETGKDTPRSWHILVARDGTIYQSLSLLTAGWHIQKGGMIGMNYYRSLNKATVAISLENVGRLKSVDGRWRCVSGRKNTTGPEVTVTEPVKRGSAHYVPYTDSQKESAVHLMHALMRRFDWKPKAFAYGHRTFDFMLHDDPGPIWMEDDLPQMMEQLSSKG